MMTIDERIDHYCAAAESRATTRHGKIRAAVKMLRTAGQGWSAPSRRVIVAEALADRRPGPRQPIDDDERARRRAAADPRFRRRMLARRRRLIRRAETAAAWLRALPEIRRLSGILGLDVPPPPAEYADYLEYAREVARCGGEYSGDTEHDAALRPGQNVAETRTYRGDRYSRRCTWHRTDAVHRVAIDPASLPHPSDPRVRESLTDGLPLLAWDPATGAATWARVSRKALTTEDGWYLCRRVGREWVTYHSTRSLRHCRRGLMRKVSEVVARHRRERADRRMLAMWLWRHRHDRLTWDAPRLCGYCRPGVQQWMARHGITPDRATVARVWRTRDPRARLVIERLATAS